MAFEAQCQRLRRAQLIALMADCTSASEITGSGAFSRLLPPGQSLPCFYCSFEAVPFAGGCSGT